MAVTPTVRRARLTWRATTLLGVLVLIGAACGGAAETTTTTPVSDSSSTTAAPVVTTAPTTTQEVTTTAPAVPTYAVASHGAGAVAALAGSDGMLGSGCVPGEGPLPDGIWFGWADKDGTGITFDLACLADETPPVATNSNPTLRDVEPVADLAVRHRDGSTETWAEWSPTTEPVWVYINHSLATEIAYPTMDITIDTGDDAAWTEASVSLPVGGGCCGEMYRGPVSPADDWPASGLPADGVYGVDMTVDLANNDLVFDIRKFILCSERPDLCISDYVDEDVALNHEDAITRRVALDEDLTVRLMGIHVDPTIDPTAVLGIEGPGEAFARLLEDNAAAFEAWVAPQLAAGDDYQDIYEELVTLGADDPTFPYTQSMCCDADWSPLIYRGPLGVELVEWLFEPNGFIGPTQLEIVDGLPVLTIDGGRIAG